MPLRRFAAAILGMATAALAQPVVTGVANVASFALSPLPHSGIAQGSMFTVFGSGLGPASIQIVNSFPLSTTMGGTSIRVTSGGTTVNALMIFTVASQVAAILPSNTPTGDASLTVSLNNQTSASFPFRVVRSSFGTFALNQAGSGPGIVTDANFVPNTLVQSANPRDVMILWGTGLGPVAGDEAAGPLPGELAVDTRVLVGGRAAAVTYHGRSGCCAGLDQIVFTVPEGVEGCYVPVAVVVGTVTSNFTTMSIAPSGRVCSDRLGLLASHLQQAQSAGTLRVGSIGLTRTQTTFVNPSPFPALTLRADTLSATFGRYTANQLLASLSLARIPAGTCAVGQFRGGQFNLLDPTRPTALDAGTLTLTGPRGAKSIPRQTSTGLYSSQLGGGGQDIPGLGTGFQPDYLERGAYTVTNSSGTATVGAFNASLTIGDELNWTNRASLRSVNRTQPLTVTWSGGDGAAEFVDIAGASVLAGVRVGAGFACRERATAGTFTIPAEVLSSLPPSEIQEGLPTGYLAVDASPNPVTFQATGLDLGLFSFTRISGLVVAYQ
jgi:uncharacterized protein (TIGR03437 family)